MKAYVKPELFYESYELSQHIADCALEMNSADVSTCSANPDPDQPTGLLPGYTVFLSQPTCDFVLDKYCETMGTGGLNTFMS